MHDIHTHIGQFWNTYYDYHDVFLALKNNGIAETTLAYLTPRIEDEKNALEFYYAVTEELKEAKVFAEEIGLKTNILYWADPLVLKKIALEEIFSVHESIVSEPSGNVETTQFSVTSSKVELSTSNTDFSTSLRFARNDKNYDGIALHPTIHAWTRDFPDVLTRIFSFAQKRNLPIYIHTGVSEHEEPMQFEQWFEDFTEVKVHLAHCKDPEPIIRLFSKHKNLVGDTAFCPKDSYEAICSAGFKDRMFFGTDFPITQWYEHLGEENFPTDEKTLTESYAKTLNLSLIL